MIDYFHNKITSKYTFSGIKQRQWVVFLFAAFAVAVVVSYLYISGDFRFGKCPPPNDPCSPKYMTWSGNCRDCPK